LKPACAPSIVSTSDSGEPWNSVAAMISIDMFTSPATPIAISTSTRWKRSSLCFSASSRGGCGPGQRRVQIDHVRHDGRAEDAGGKEDAVAAAEAGDEAAEELRADRLGYERLVEEAEQDHGKQGDDRYLERPVTAVLARPGSRRRRPL